jgi:integrase
MPGFCGSFRKTPEVTRMPRPKNPVPTYRLHKQSGQAIVTVSANGTRKDLLLGKYNSPESKEEYRRVLADLEAGRLRLDAPADITVNELCARYWKHALEYYPNGPDGKEASELADFRYAIREFREFAGHAPAREFGPLAYKALRERMVRRGWSRPWVNRQCGRVKRIIRWAVENELLPADRWEALRSVPGLAAGRTPAREPEPIGPVDEAHYRAVLPHVSGQVRGLLELLELTGMRPGEACRIRPCEIDQSGAVWVYRPTHHKTKHRGKERAVPLGARSQELLKRFAPADPADFYFSPARAEAERKAARPPKRVRKGKPAAAPGTRRPGKAYSPHAVAIAVERACEKAGVPHWHPNQLRHLFATRVRRMPGAGLEAAQVLLGHSRADVTQVYAEKNLALAAKVAAEIG